MALPTDPLNLLLNGQTPPFVPVAPAYEGLGPLQFHRMALRYGKWRDRLAAAGVTRLPVDYVRRTSTWSCRSTPRSWIGTTRPRPGSSCPRSVPQTTWRARLSSGEGRTCTGWRRRAGRTGYRPHRETYAERFVADKTQSYAHLWEQRAGLEEIVVQAEARSAARREPSQEEVAAYLASGRLDLARRLLARYPNNLPLYVYDSTPYNSLLGTFGFQDMMTAMLEHPDLVHRLLAARAPVLSAGFAAAQELGVGIVFIEECLASADLISPQCYREFSFPYTKQMLEYYEELGFRTVLYFSGNLMPLLSELNQLPFTGLSFEENRKDYGTDLVEVRRGLPDKVLFGNVDAAWLETATDDEVRIEVRRQVRVAGQEGRYALSVGSPFTPGTSLERVRFFCEATRGL